MALLEGNSIRGTERMCGVNKTTIAKLLRDVGCHCKNFHDRHVRGVKCKSIEADELWSFVYKRRRKQKDGEGSFWTWTAVCPDSKLLVCYRVGERNFNSALDFAHDLAGRLTGRIQLSTDGLGIYQLAIADAFGAGGIDYAQVVKEYIQLRANEYEPWTTRVIFGRPDASQITTNHVERHNLTMRTRMRRLMRRTNAHSKSPEYHLYAMALWAVSYNFCTPHGTLTKARRIKTTPAMAAGLAEKPWSVADVLALLSLDNPAHDFELTRPLRRRVVA